MTSKDKNFELNDKELERVSGGSPDSGDSDFSGNLYIPVYCYYCKQTSYLDENEVINGFTCPKCGQYNSFK